MTADAAYMKQALILARKGIGRVSPNPAVGCVIVKDSKVAGLGWHRKAGTPHAEIHALEMAGESARDADVYVTLEPCCHTGRTPPCSDALIRAGVKRVVIGMSDPNPKVSGGGVEALKKAGIEVKLGVLEQDCRELNLPFIKHITSGFPYVTYKWAMTLDGKTAASTGASRWISCDRSRKYVHRMRSRMDAVMLGVGSVIADDPELTVRHVKGKNPIRIVVDSQLRTPMRSKVFTHMDEAETIIATTMQDTQAHRPYVRIGAGIIVCKEENGRVSPADLMLKLGKRGIQSILLEGGGTLAASMLEREQIDEFVFFIAPKIIGADGISPFNLAGRSGMDQAAEVRITRIGRIGSDIIAHARPEVLCSRD